jgi:hypothetical protein
MGIFDDIGGFFGIGGSRSSTSENFQRRTDIPEWLAPFYGQLMGSGLGTIQNLTGLANRSPDEMVAGFDPAQIAGQNEMLAAAQGSGGFLPTAQQQFLQTAAGRGLGSILDSPAYDALRQNALGGYSALSDPARRSLEAAAGGQGVGPGGEALAAHARGDYLYGGEGFNNALQAAMNQIQPQVQSRFGQAGPGASTGGLAQAAMNQGTSDAFANLYSQNLNRQVGAANTLTGQSLTGANALGSFGAQDLARQMSAASQLGNFGMQERGNALNAAAALPNLAMFAPNAMMNVGAQRQGLAQQRLDAPFAAQLQLLEAIYGGAPAFQSLLGQSGSGTQSSEEFGFNLGF